MNFTSYFTSVSKMLEKANTETAEQIAALVQKKAHDRAPVQGGTSADGRYRSRSRKPKKKPPGTYRKQIEASFDGDRVVLGVNNLLGVYLEKGTKNAPAYPHMQPAFEESTREIKEILKGAYEKHVR